jgi:hypothetical protein
MKVFAAKVAIMLLRLFVIVWIATFVPLILVILALWLLTTYGLLVTCAVLGTAAKCIRPAYDGIERFSPSSRIYRKTVLWSLAFFQRARSAVF